MLYAYDCFVCMRARNVRLSVWYVCMYVCALCGYVLYVCDVCMDVLLYTTGCYVCMLGFAMLWYAMYVCCVDHECYIVRAF